MPKSTTPIQRIGVIGLGAMGLGVAQSLLRGGFEVGVYDVRTEAVQKAADAGGTAAASPAALATKVEALIIVVVNAQQTEEVLFGERGAAPNLESGSVVIASATVAPDFASALGVRLQGMGLHLIDAPMSGGVAKAASGELTLMAAGEPAVFTRCEGVFQAIASRVYRLGDRPGPGSTAKMINQLLAGVHIAAAAEAMAFGMHAGADPAQLYEVICNSAGGSWMFQNRVPHILAGDYTPLSAVNIFVKDLGIVLDYARKNPFPLPLSATAHQMFLQAAAAGLGREDDSAVVKIFPNVSLPQSKSSSGYSGGTSSVSGPG